MRYNCTFNLEERCGKQVVFIRNNYFTHVIVVQGLSQISFVSVQWGRLTILSLKTVTELPPPSRLRTWTAPRDCIHSAHWYNVNPWKSVSIPSAWKIINSPLSFTPIAVRGAIWPPWRNQSFDQSSTKRSTLEAVILPFTIIAENPVINCSKPKDFTSWAFSEPIIKSPDVVSPNWLLFGAPFFIAN